jgi:hypothetical protein
MGKIVLLLLLAVAGIYAYEHYFGVKTPPPRLAPEGTVFNLARTNAAADGVFVGIPPGSELQLIERNAGIYTVEYRGVRFTLPDTMVTRDLDAAEQIRGETRSEGTTATE